MKLLILSVFVVVLIAQWHDVQGTPAASTVITDTLEDIPLSDILNTIALAVANVTTRVTTDIDSAIVAGSQLINDEYGTKNKPNPALSAKAHLEKVARKVFQTISNTLNPISKFHMAVSKLITNDTVLLSNPIGTIKRAIAGLNSKIKSSGHLRNAAKLVSKANTNARATSLPEPVTLDELVTFAVDTLPMSFSSDFDAINIASNNIDSVLIRTSNLMNALARQSGKGKKVTPTSTLSIKASSKNALKKNVEAINSVQSSINKAINSLANVEDVIQAVCNERLQNVIVGFKAVGSTCVGDAINALNDLAADAIRKARSCASNEILTLKNYLAKYKDLAAQYQAAVANNTISISTLKKTIRNSIAFKLYLIAVKFRVEGCVAATILEASGSLVPIAVSTVKCEV